MNGSGDMVTMTFDRTVKWHRTDIEGAQIFQSPLSKSEDRDLLNPTVFEGAEIVGSGQDGVVSAVHDRPDRVIKHYHAFPRFSRDAMFATLRANESLRVGLERVSQRGAWEIGGVAILAAALYEVDANASNHLACVVMERVEHLDDEDSLNHIPPFFNRQAPPGERRRLGLYRAAMRATEVPERMIPVAIQSTGSTIDFDDHPDNLLITRRPKGSFRQEKGEAIKIDITARKEFNF